NALKGRNPSQDFHMCQVQGIEVNRQTLPHLRGASQPRKSLPARLLASKDAAVYLGISTWTLRQWYRRGLIQAAVRVSPKRWLWDLEDLNDCVKRIKT